MSRFLIDKYKDLVPYTPGEQPQDGKYIKLNTNESPYMPSQSVIDFLSSEEAKALRLYSDPECKKSTSAVAKYYGVENNQVIMVNGSDEVLAFIYMAFFDKDNDIYAPDISYGFYPVYCKLCGLKYNAIPLKEDFTLDIEAFARAKGGVIFANPNAPTGLAISLKEIEYIVQNNKNLVIVDEAYVDFGAESAIPLVNKYDNLIITQTLSKSRSLAGARIGFAISNKDIIEDLNKIKFSFNPYNVNRLSDMCAKLAFEDERTFKENTGKIQNTRAWLIKELRDLGFEVLDSKANFIFVKPKGITAKDYYFELKKRRILIRYFSKERINEYVRISIGTDTEVKALVEETKDLIRQ
ncbi:MAG: histidinol-phosphate transaminase [Christensenellales bacterium]|jgi:histidinol-phosphate aminotransferase